MRKKSNHTAADAAVPPPALTGKAMRGLPTLDQAVRQWDGGRLGRA